MGLAERSRTLILCVDQDNDVGKKTGVTTPIIGKESNIHAASTLAIADPEEADANAMFGAVRILNQMNAKYPQEEFELATITGTPFGGVEAHRKMMQELEAVLKVFPANGIVLVTDGFADDVLDPIIRSRVPITSIQHVVVKHSERIEETYAVFFKYLKMLVDDPYYSRIALGVPGVLFIIFGFLIALNQLQNAGLAVSFVIGFVLFVKGFGIYNRVVEYRPRVPPPEKQLIVISRLVGTVLALLGGYQGVYGAYTMMPSQPQPLTDISYWASVAPRLIGHFIIKGIDMIALGVFIAFLGSAVYYYMNNDERVGNNVISAILAFWMWLISLSAADVLINPNVKLSLFSPLVYYTVASVATTILAVAILYRRYKKLPFT